MDWFHKRTLGLSLQEQSRTAEDGTWWTSLIQRVTNSVAHNTHRRRERDHNNQRNSVEEVVGKKELSDTPGGSVNWYSHYG